MDTTNPCYIAIIGDLIDSKNIEHRQEVQTNLLNTLDRINSKYCQSIVSKFKITLGDEFEGLMSVNGDWICIINELFFSLHPTKIQFGVGVGNITTQIQAMNIQEMDGTAFDLARKAIEQLAKEKQKYRGNINYFKIYIHDQSKTEIMNNTLSLLSILYSSYTSRQVEILHAYMNHEMNQFKTAAFLKIGQPAISKILKKTEFYKVKDSWDLLNTLVMSIEENG